MPYLARPLVGHFQKFITWLLFGRGHGHLAARVLTLRRIQHNNAQSGSGREEHPQ